MDAFEQPDAYAPITPSAFRGMVEYAATLDETEQRQAYALACFPHSNAEYVRFMTAVQQHMQVAALRKEDNEDDLIARRAKQAYCNLRGDELGKQRFSEEKYAASGAHAAVGIPGGDAIFEGADSESVPIWGDGGDVLMADGESLMLCGSSGVGKTTVAAQFVRARIGLTTHALGYAVQPTSSKVLYLACDRPNQTMKILRRLFKPEELDAINAKLTVRKGPPPKDFAQNIDCLLELCLEYGADTVIVDSLKDVALGLSKDDVSAGYNMARQLCLANGIQVLELHHQVKRGADGGAPNTLADVYGGTWLTAGSGSVILLDGKAGDMVVKFRHLKQPVNAIGPIDLYHDQETGISTFAEKINWVALAGVTPLTVKDAAKIKYETEKPTRNEIEVTRRDLEAATRTGLLMAVPGLSPKAPTTYVPRSLKDYDSTPEQAPPDVQDTLV